MFLDRSRRARPVCEVLEVRELPACACLASAEAPDSARIVNGQATSAFPSVGLVGDTTGDGCTGTLIAPRYVLTAAHCAEGVRPAQGRFTVGGVTYSTSRIFIHPSYNGNRIGEDAANDIAIFELSEPVVGVEPSPIYRQTPAVGQLLTLVGFGAGGTAAGGQNGDFGTKRVGSTPIDGVSAKLITWDYDNRTESNTAPGDSGGPAFLQVDGVYHVAGVTSGGDNATAGLGDHSFDTRVDAYAAWIDSVVNGTPAPPAEADDHGDSFTEATTLALEVGNRGSATGLLGASTDRDVFRFAARAAGTVSIDLRALSGGLDTVLRIYDARGRLVAMNDDFGTSLSSRVRLRVARGATYYAHVSAYDGSTGDYRLSIAPATRERVTRAAARDQVFAALGRRRDALRG